jgi:hypothetical protein
MAARVVLLLLGVVGLADALGFLTMRINNCLEDDLIFLNCVDVVGTASTPTPTKTPQFGHSTWKIEPPSEFGTGSGNCTWKYTNKHGEWILFADWTFSFLGGSAYGAGTNDVIDRVLARNVFLDPDPGR